MEEGGINIRGGEVSDIQDDVPLPCQKGSFSACGARESKKEIFTMSLTPSVSSVYNVRLGRSPDTAWLILGAL